MADHTNRYDEIRASECVHKVFKLTDEHLRLFDECVRDGHWALDAALLSKYSKLLTERQTRDSQLYASFQNLCNTLLDKIEAALPEGISFSKDPVRLWRTDNEQHKSYTAAQSRKPHLLIAPRSLLTNQTTTGTWGSMMFPLEVKRTKPSRKEDPFYLQLSPRNFKSHSPPCFRSRKTKQGDPRLMPHKPLFGPPSSPIGKHSRSDDSSDDEDEDGHNEVRLRTSVTEMTLSVYRLFGIGITLHNDTLSLRCYDCMGAFSMIKFNFVTDTRLTMLVLFAMSICSPVDAGYNPFHKSKDGGHATEWKDSYFRFLDLDGREFKYLVDGDTPLYIAQEILHRRTIVIPVHAEAEVSSPKVLKLSWIDPVHRCAETETIRDILALTPELAPYLPRVDFSRLYDSERDLHLPRFALNARLDSPPRHLLASVVQRFSPLWEANDLEEFKHAFIDVVECHHRTYVKGRVLHRDIGEDALPRP